MRDAIRSARARVKQLRRQKMAWFYENAQDQGDYWKILKAEDQLEDEIAEKQAALDKVRESKAEKENEMAGINRTQLALFDEEIRKATENLEKLIREQTPTA